jgi:thiol-disulfide isomerase/thioredoxin
MNTKTLLGALMVLALGVGGFMAVRYTRQVGENLNSSTGAETASGKPRVRFVKNPKPIPDLTMTTLDGKTVTTRDLAGKVAIFNFWATWCAPCLKEMPELSALDAMREHIEVVGLAYEEIELKDMQAFLADHPVVYPIAIVDVYNPPADFETPRGLPMTYLIAPDGKVAKRFLGPVTAKEIESAIGAAGGPTAGV